MIKFNKDVEKMKIKMMKKKEVKRKKKHEKWMNINQHWFDMISLLLFHLFLLFFFDFLNDFRILFQIMLPKKWNIFGFYYFEKIV